MANGRRGRPMVAFTLSVEAIARLAQIAEQTGASKSAIVERLILAEPNGAAAYEAAASDEPAPSTQPATAARPEEWNPWKRARA